MQFPEYDEMDDQESWKASRYDCAGMFADGSKTLCQVGFEYRKRTGTHRYQDAWLDFSIIRSGGRGALSPGKMNGGHGGQVSTLRPLAEMRYAFPEVWTPTRLLS